MQYFNLVLCLVLSMFCSISAQNLIQEDSEKKSDKLGETKDTSTRILPQKWSIKEEVQTIEKSLGSYDPLIQSLEEANNDLKADLAAYLKNPGDQVLATRITAKMSNYAKKIVWDVDKITSSQDTLLSVFTELNRKLDKVNGYLDYKVTELDDQQKKYQGQGKELKKQLIELSRKIKDTEDEKAKEQLTNEFRRVFNNFNINQRYEQGLSRNKEDYAALSKNLKSMVKMFTILNQAFRGLIESLEAEKNYLLDNIRLQADAIRVQKLVHEGISDGSRAVVQVTQKLAVLYARVEGFAKIHEKINRDMSKFSDSTKILSSLVQQIEGAPFQSAPTVDKAIDYFYSLRDKEE